MLAIVAIRDVLLCLLGVWYVEFHLDFRFPEDNLLLYFVAIPIIWAALTQIWTSVSYRELTTPLLSWIGHLITMLILVSSVFLISATLNTIGDSLDTTGDIWFHFVGWTVLAALVFYDLVDMGRR